MDKRIRLLFSGVVQGVGFRPFIHRVATEHGLRGFVRNRADGVVVEVEGNAASIEGFYGDVLHRLPPHARISEVSRQDILVTGGNGFHIALSDDCGRKEIRIPPDIATCDECLRELFDHSNRRFEYPFVNCTNCGPRFTILRDVPYDRNNTSMACMPLCPECLTEYASPVDRRFHAEPNACPVCGPTLWIADAGGITIPTATPVEHASDLLRQGYIVAIKGLGGFHLGVDARNDAAVSRLRERKYREEKPLALMVRDKKSASLIAEIGPAEEAQLFSPARPIVLVKKRDRCAVSLAVAPGVPYHGLMLPSTPLHHLLLRDFPALVMTSANRVEEPICIGNREAIGRLAGIADFFLFHDRDILVRCDDSLVMTALGKARVLRRARGFVPSTVKLRTEFVPVLALGPQMKTTICLLKGNEAFLSQHIGDMETPEARDFYRETLSLMRKITQAEPGIVACDLHPAYHTSLLARQMEGIELEEVQHHHAHVVSCMAENGLGGEVIGIAMDGTGYGSDGTVWGGEFLLASEAAFRRMGRLGAFPLPGGEMAIREPWRVGASLLQRTYGEAWDDIATEISLFPVRDSLNWLARIINNERISPSTSSLGRMFDGIAALIGLHKVASFEGQPAMGLEALASVAGKGKAYDFTIQKQGEVFVLNLFPSVDDVVKALLAGRTKTEIAGRFHSTLALAFAEMAMAIRQETGLERVVLSGGCFQNKILLEECTKELSRRGFTVFSHSIVPTNDGGVALGQAVVAAARHGRGVVSPGFHFSAAGKDGKT